MRPVARLTLFDAHGNLKSFSTYQEARPDLILAFGEYCSYCEMHLDASLAVEHVQPKDLNPGLALSWSNFLLGCTNCNSTKSNKAPGLANCFWPDRDGFGWEPCGDKRLRTECPCSQRSRPDCRLERPRLHKQQRPWQQGRPFSLWEPAWVRHRHK